MDCCFCFVSNIQFSKVPECPVHNYVCDNTSCIHKSKWCDGVVDCNDQSDEDDYCKGKLLSSFCNDILTTRLMR